MLPDILGEGYSACSKQKLKDYQTSYQAHMATRQEMTSPAVPIMPAVRSPSILCGSHHWGTKKSSVSHPTRSRIMNKVPGYNKSTLNHKSPCGRELSPNKGVYLRLLSE